MNIKKTFILLVITLLFPLAAFADDVSTNSNIYTLDANDTGGDVSLKYGATNNETLDWTTDSVSATDWFQLSDGLGLHENNTQTSAGTGLTVENEGTGDSLLQMVLTGVTRWVFGIDNSDDDKFKIASSADLDSDTVLTIDTDGYFGFGAGPTPKYFYESGSIEIPDGKLKVGKMTINDYYPSIGWNAYYDGGGDARWEYIDGNAAFATQLHEADDKLYTYYAPIGSVDGPITWGIGIALDSTGKVGIGTASPEAKLDVNGTLYVRNTLRALGAIEQTAQGVDRIDLGVQDETPRMVFEDSGSTIWLVDNSDGKFRWFTPGVEQMNLETSSSNPILTLKNSSGVETIKLNTNGDSYFNGGNVGIGTTTPAYNLDVEDAVGLNKETNGGSINIKSTNNTNYGLGFFASENAPIYTNINPGNQMTSLGMSGRGTGYDDSGLHIMNIFRIFATDYIADQVNFESLNIVSIKDESYLFNSYAEGSGSRQPIILQAKGGTDFNQFYIGTDGKVGIGTTTPAYNLDVEDAVGLNKETYGGSINIKSASGSTYGLGFLANNNLIYANTAVGNQMTSLGISGRGTGYDDSGLHVMSLLRIYATDYMADQGNNESLNIVSLKDEAYLIASSKLGTGSLHPIILQAEGGTDYNQFYIGTDGKVGIGTTTPASELEVNGQIKSALGSHMGYDATVCTSGCDYSNLSIASSTEGVGKSFYVSADTYTLSTDFILLANQSWHFEEKNGGVILDGDGTYSVRTSSYGSGTEYSVSLYNSTLTPGTPSGKTTVTKGNLDWDLSYVAITPSNYYLSYAGELYPIDSANDSTDSVIVNADIKHSGASNVMIQILKNPITGLVMIGKLSINNCSEGVNLILMDKPDFGKLTLDMSGSGVRLSMNSNAGGNLGTIIYSNSATDSNLIGMSSIGITATVIAQNNVINSTSNTFVLVPYAGYGNNITAYINNNSNIGSGTMGPIYTSGHCQKGILKGIILQNEISIYYEGSNAWNISGLVN